jgi:hypothetical protein
LLLFELLVVLFKGELVKGAFYVSEICRACRDEPALDESYIGNQNKS